MSGNCNAGEVRTIPQKVIMIIKSFTDSLEFGKPTRAFNLLIGSLSTINPELNKLSSTSTSPANRQFFIALYQILSVPGFKVNDESVTAILKSAEGGCKDAAEMVSATFGKKPSEITDKKAFLKMHMQKVLDESASDSDSSNMDSEEKDMGEEKDFAEHSGDLTVNETMEKGFDDRTLLGDPLYVAETVRQLADNLYSFLDGKEKDIELIKYDFDFLARAKYDPDYLKRLAEKVRQKDAGLYDSFSDILKGRE